MYAKLYAVCTYVSKHAHMYFLMVDMQDTFCMYECACIQIDTYIDPCNSAYIHPFIHSCMCVNIQHIYTCTCLPTYIWMFNYIHHTDMHTFIYDTCIHICMYIYTSVYTHIYRFLYVCLHTNMHAKHTYSCMSAYLNTCLYFYICMSVHTYINAYIQTCTHAYTKHVCQYTYTLMYVGRHT